MTPGKLNLYIDQGGSYRANINYKIEDYDFSDVSWSALMQIRKHPADSGSPVLIEVTDADGLTFGEDWLVIELSPVDTEKLTRLATGYRAVYDIKCLSSDTGEVVFFLKGNIIIRPEVSREEN